MRLRFSLPSLFLIGAFAAAASAGPINITESTDFPNSGILAPFILDVGANTIAGTESAVASDLDDFAFTIPAGLELTSGTVSLGVVPGVVLAQWSLRTGSTAGAGISLDGLLAFVGASDSLDAGLLPLSAGTYHFHGTTVTGTIPYTFTLQVAPTTPVPTPEPTSLLLLGTGLAGLIARRASRPS